MCGPPFLLTTGSIYSCNASSRSTTCSSSLTVLFLLIKSSTPDRWDGDHCVAKWGNPTGMVELYSHHGHMHRPNDFDSYENENLAWDPHYEHIVAHHRQLLLHHFSTRAHTGCPPPPRTEEEAWPSLESPHTGPIITNIRSVEWAATERI